MRLEWSASAPLTTGVSQSHTGAGDTGGGGEGGGGLGGGGLGGGGEGDGGLGGGGGYTASRVCVCVIAVSLSYLSKACLCLRWSLP